MTLKTIIFDLDGTLVDSDPDLANALNKLLADYDIPALSHAQVRNMVGNGAWKLVERGFRASDTPLPDELDKLVQRFIVYYNTALDVETTLYPNVIETLSQLKAQGYKMGLCTNKPIGSTKKVLDAYKLTQFMDVVVGGDSFSFKKPDGRHITQLIDQMDCPLASAVMVGDSQNDVYAARDAGIPVIFLTHGYSRVSAKELAADATLDNFTEIFDALNKLSSNEGCQV